MKSYLIIRIPFELGQAVVYKMSSSKKRALNKMLKLILLETGNFKGNRKFLYQAEKAGYKVGGIDGDGRTVVYDGNDDEWLLYPSTKTKEVSDGKTQNKGSKTR